MRLAKTKALRLLLPYVGIGVCFLLPVRLAVGYPSYQNMGMEDFAVKLLTSSDMGHLWFLPALFLVFVLSELILTIAEKIPGVKKHPELFLCFVSFAMYLEGYRIGFGYPPLMSAYSYLLWFSLGYTLNIWQNMLKKIYACVPVKWGLILVNLVLISLSVSAGNMRMILSLLMKALCVINAYGAMPDKSFALVEKIDRNSFGIYLFHSPLIYITFANIPNAHPGIVVFINLVVFGAAAFGVTELIRKTRLKVLIGE